MAIIVTNDGIKIMINRTFNETPTKSVPSQFKVGTGTTNPTIIDTDLEVPVTISISEVKGFESGYPIIDENAQSVTFRGFLNLLEANGNNLTEFGVFNSDETPLMFSRSTHDTINKTNVVQIAYVEKERFDGV